MGRLIAKAYATKSLAYLADHTYVECGAGARGWGCWGGKTGGRTLGYGDNASTLRADAIAEPNERAGITCYGINGVCHQAANRILIPVDGEVHGANGYSLSAMIFGIYGRPFGPGELCAAPIKKHTSITGDFDECSDIGSSHPEGELAGEEKYRSIARTNSRDLYEKPEFMSPSTNSRLRFQLAQVEIFATPRLSSLKDAPAQLANLMDVKYKFETSRINLEDYYAERGALTPQFAMAFNELTVAFQQRLGHALPRDSYISLLNSLPEQPWVLLNPEDFTPRPQPRRVHPNRPS
jgi:hypothetical protein